MEDDHKLVILTRSPIDLPVYVSEMLLQTSAIMPGLLYCTKFGTYSSHAGQTSYQLNYMSGPRMFLLYLLCPKGSWYIVDVLSKHYFKRVYHFLHIYIVLNILQADRRDIYN